MHACCFRLVAASDCLQELDLEDNLIGDMGASELIEGLMERKEGEYISLLSGKYEM